MSYFIQDLLFPKRCVHCKRWGQFLCEQCLYEIDFLAEQFCPVCGKTAVLGLPHPRCVNKRQHKSHLDQIYSLCWYRGPIRTLINKFKFKPTVRSLTEVFRFLMRRGLLAEDTQFWENATITAVPLHPSSQRERGFNQARLIAQILAQTIELSTQFDLLIKTHPTPHQSGLDKITRRQNVRGVFRIQPDLIDQPPNKVILVDDVYTTGSTLNECARVLKRELGVQKIHGFTLARG